MDRVTALVVFSETVKQGRISATLAYLLVI